MTDKLTDALGLQEDRVERVLNDVDWIGVDWGTSNLRAYAMSSTHHVMAEASSDQGMSKLAPDQFEQALLSLIQPWLIDDRVMPVYACGMVGARQGWVEAQYLSVPCHPVNHQAMTLAPTKSPQIMVSILPGLSQNVPADVMRGEETQLAGIMALDDERSATVCLPGTHSKWVSMSDGNVTGFRTFMTGELFWLLGEQSVLRHGMASDQWDQQAFLDSACSAIEDPGRVMSRLFSLRAAGLLADVKPHTARSMLSGMLIGQELGTIRDWWNDKSVIIVGATKLSSLYADTLSLCGATPRRLSASEATIAGLTYASTSARGETQ